MANMFSLLSGAMKGAGPQKNSADNADQARLRAEHDQAVAHYGDVLRSTNDKGEIAKAHDALMKATAALGA